MKITKMAVIAWVVLLITVGCTTNPPIRNPQILKSNLPQKHFIESVPTYRQTYMDCGPTSIRMILNFYGKHYSQEEIVKARWGRGTAISDMESYVRSQGFQVHSFNDWNKEKMKYLIAQGYPLIALGEIPSNWYRDGRYAGEGHYVVVVGYDDTEKTFAVNDPAGGQKMKISYEIFKNFHSPTKQRSFGNPQENYYVLCIYPKGN